MDTSKKGSIIVLVLVCIGIFGYSQYASASEIEVNITQSELFDKNENGLNYNVELQFENPSLLLLNAGETEFFVISNDIMVGKGELEPFMLQPLDSSYVKGTFYTDSSINQEVGSVKITGVMKYDAFVTSIDIPFVYYPTEEQAREFIHQN